MPNIDLERLIVKQTYSVPVKASYLKTAISKELEASEPLISGIRGWRLVEEHKNNFQYEFSLKHAFVFNSILGLKSGTRKCNMLIKKKSDEYDKGLPKSYFGALKRVQSGLPLVLYVFVTNTEEKRCICDIECLPALYQKLNMKEVKEATEFELQDAYLSCRRFVKAIFESGISATRISEGKIEPSKLSFEFMVNDESTRQILERIETMFNGATIEILIMGWIGTIFLPKLRELKEKGVKIRVITHRADELKGRPGRQDAQRGYRELTSIIGPDNISIRPEVHGRAVIVDNKALIGSMDLNSHSLTGEHREIAIYTEEPEIVRNLRNYFNRIFSPLKKTE